VVTPGKAGSGSVTAPVLQAPSTSGAIAGDAHHPGDKAQELHAKSLPSRSVSPPVSLRSGAVSIVVSWNNVDLLPECLQSLKSQTYPDHQIVVVDNDSKDDSIEYLRREHPDVEVVQLDWNSGFAHANNVGIRHAFNDENVGYVVFVNSDARLAPNWIETMVNNARIRPKAASFQSLTLDYANNAVIDSHHIYVARTLQATQASNREVHMRTYETELVFGVNAAAAMYTRAFLDAQPFEEVFDEQMGMYLEDVDLAARAIVMGWESWFVSNTYAYHMGSASSQKRANGFSLYMTYRNQPGMLLANFPREILKRALGSAIRADIQTISHLRRTNQVDLLPHLLKGRFVGLWRARKFLAKRRAMAIHRTIDPDVLWTMMRAGKLAN
jgi:GT2 family glycosyltransferase